METNSVHNQVLEQPSLLSTLYWFTSQINWLSYRCIHLCRAIVGGPILRGHHHAFFSFIVAPRCKFLACLRAVLAFALCLSSTRFNSLIRPILLNIRLMSPHIAQGSTTAITGNTICQKRISVCSSTAGKGLKFIPKYPVANVRGKNTIMRMVIRFICSFVLWALILKVRSIKLSAIVANWSNDERIVSK